MYTKFLAIIIFGLQARWFQNEEVQVYRVFWSHTDVYVHVVLVGGVRVIGPRMSVQVFCDQVL